MQTQSRHYACGKNMALGALYDAFEKLNWKLISANSDAGILIAAERRANIPFLIRVQSEQAEQTEVTMDLASGTFSNGVMPGKEAEVFLETLTSIIEDAVCR